MVLQMSGVHNRFASNALKPKITLLTHMHARIAHTRETQMQLHLVTTFVNTASCSMSKYISDAPHVVL